MKGKIVFFCVSFFLVCSSAFAEVWIETDGEGSYFVLKNPLPAGILAPCIKAIVYYSEEEGMLFYNQKTEVWESDPFVQPGIMLPYDFRIKAPELIDARREFIFSYCYFFIYIWYIPAHKDQVKDLGWQPIPRIYIGDWVLLPQAFWALWFDGILQRHVSDSHSNAEVEKFEKFLPVATINK